MKIFKNIKIKTIFTYTFLSFIVLTISIIGYSILKQYQSNNLYKLEHNLNNLKNSYTHLTKLQDQLLLYNKNQNIEKKANYPNLKQTINKIYTQTDSLIKQNNIPKITPYLENLKKETNTYEETIKEILTLNSEIYLFGTGLNQRSIQITQKLRNNPKYIELNLIPYLDEMIVLKENLFAEKIFEHKFQQLSNIITKKISTTQAKDTDKHYILTFENQLYEYSNNTLKEYSKLKLLGRNYHEGLYSKLYQQNKKINTNIAKYEQIISKIRKKQTTKAYIFYSIILLTIIIIGFIIIIFLSKLIFKPWEKLQKILLKIATGQFPEIKFKPYLSELTAVSKNLNKLIQNLSYKNKFINELEARNYSIEFNYTQDDIISKSLNKLKQDLIKSEKEALQYRETEEHQKWSANGIAKIGAIMRQYTTENIFDLSKNILRNILEYIGAVQGVIFINNKEKNQLEQTAAYSYGKQRLKNNVIIPYEGLLGTILIEKKEYFISKIPDNYLFLETGFGYAKPKSIFAFPLLFENSVYGIIEIASLEIIPEYKRQFLLTLADEIAITISYTEINIQTKKLLDQSKKQALDLQSNEKLFKKNQENLKSLLRMTEEQLNEKEQVMKERENIIKTKIDDLLKIEKELATKEDHIENIINEYENIKSTLEHQNSELRERITILERRIREQQ